MKKMMLALTLCAAMLPSFAQADPPPYDPISICDIPNGTCDPYELVPETSDFVCSILNRLSRGCWH